MASFQNCLVLKHIEFARSYTAARALSLSLSLFPPTRRLVPFTKDVGPVGLCYFLQWSCDANSSRPPVFVASCWGSLAFLRQVGSLLIVGLFLLALVRRLLGGFKRLCLDVAVVERRVKRVDA